MITCLKVKSLFAPVVEKNVIKGIVIYVDNYKNVITNTMMERIASPNGPTEGKILRPSDNKKVDKYQANWVELDVNKAYLRTRHFQVF